MTTLMIWKLRNLAYLECGFWNIQNGAVGPHLPIYIGKWGWTAMLKWFGDT